MKKSLLNESEIRKFMKFANITPLTENFLDRVQEEAVTEEAVTEEAVTEEETVTEEAVTEDETVTEEVLAEEPEETREALTDLLAMVADWAKEQGIDVTVADEGVDGEGAAADISDEEAEMDLEPVPDEEPGPVGMPPEEEVEIEDEVMQEALLRKITARVANRLLRESKK